MKSKASIKPLENVILEPNIEKLAAARTAFGVQSKAAKMLGFHNQTVISRYENGGYDLSRFNYSLMMLAYQAHDNYELKAKKSAKTLSDFLIEPKNGLEDISLIIKNLKNKADLNQDELGDFVGCDTETIEYYENGNGKSSNRFYTMLMLVFKKHPYFYLKLRKE